MKMASALIASLLIIVAYFPYLRDIYRGKNRPHPYSWFISGFVTLLVFGLQISDGAGWGSLPTVLAGTAGLSVFFMSLRYKRATITRSDTVFFILALFATGLWLVADQPLLSVIVVCFIDIFAFIPTVRKSWKHPEEETAMTYGVNAVRFSFSALAIQNFTLVTALYPLVTICIDGSIFIYLLIRRRTLKK